MASRYLALLRAPSNQPPPLIREIAERTGLRVIHEAGPLIVFSDPKHAAVPLAGDAGLLVGDVFSRDDASKPVQSIGAEQTGAILASTGAALLDQVWGGYVAFLQNPSSGEPMVLRDPSGTLPCYFSQTPEGVWFSAEIEDLFAAGVPLPDIDWAYLSHHIRFSDLPTQRTALIGVHELMAGFRLSAVDGRFTTSPYWSPWSHVSRPVDPTPDTLAERLRETVRDCVRAWGIAYPHVLLGVSGGLDSSIVATCLAGTDTSVTGFTLATHEAEGDERHYARALADALRMPLLEAFHDLTHIDVTRPTNPHLPRPGAPAFGQSGIRTMLEAASTRPIDAFFTGIGGDNVFCFSQSATPLLDRYVYEGIGSGTWQTLNDICRLTGCSYWEAIGAAVKKHRSRKASRLWRGLEWPETFLTPYVPINTPDGPPHPWLDAPPDALPGKIAHVAGLVRIQGTLDSFPRHTIAPQIHPLLSQPIVELCLQIPSWQWISKGRNRSVARQAFERDLPEIVRRRRSKGGPTHFACAVVDANLAILRDHLIGGLLEQHGILNKGGIEPMLSGQTPLKAADHMRLSILAEAESWARHCTRRQDSPQQNRVGPAQLTPDGALL